MIRMFNTLDAALLHETTVVEVYAVTVKENKYFFTVDYDDIATGKVMLLFPYELDILWSKVSNETAAKIKAWLDTVPKNVLDNDYLIADFGNRTKYEYDLKCYNRVKEIIKES